MRLPPRPRRPDHRLEARVLRTPAEDLRRPGGTCDQHRRVARAAWPHTERDRRPDRTFRRRDDLPDRKTAAIPEVADERLIRPRVPGRRRLERPDVRIGQVRDMDVVADARPVDGGVVVAEEGQLRRPFGGGEDVRDEMRLGPMDLAESLRRAGDVEVPEADAPETVGTAVPGESALERP